jgi:glycine cleavage system H protein
MTYPSEYKYTKDHEWLNVAGTTAIVGITQFAQSELGELVFVDLPKVGTKVSAGAVLCVVESTKAASDVYCPVSGVVAEINSVLKDDPGLINRDPHAAGWLVKLSDVDTAQLDGLMSAAEYSDFAKH